MKNYNENHQKSQNFNIFLLTTAIFRGLRSVFFKTLFYCIRNISERLYFKNYCVLSFFFKNYSIFPRGGLWSPPQDMISFYRHPQRIGLTKNQCLLFWTFSWVQYGRICNQWGILFRCLNCFVRAKNLLTFI